MLHRMADEAEAGSPDHRSHRGGPGRRGAPARDPRQPSSDAFGVPVGNIYGASESRSSRRATASIHGSTSARTSPCSRSSTMRSQPVEPGQRGAKLLVTNVVNKVMPLIRYEITDELTLLPGAQPGTVDGPTHRRPRRAPRRLVRLRRASSCTRKPSDRRSPRCPSASTRSTRRRRRGRGHRHRRPGRPDVLAGAPAGRVGATGVHQRGRPHHRCVEAIERHSATAKLRRFVPLPVVSA